MELRVGIGNHSHSSLNYSKLLCILVAVVSSFVPPSLTSDESVDSSSGLTNPTNPTVEILQGKLEGKVLKSRDGRDYFAFLNVPYASSKRFQNPTPAEKWTGVYDATKMGKVCAQAAWVTLVQSGEEDCLSLNVYTPKGGGTKPVMVYFHGGGFTVGTANYHHAKYLMDEDIVLVLVNYRLGPFGFLSTQDDVISGNFGLKDQSMALKWVQKNIEHFGGDPNSVAIFGNSAGGVSVNYQMLSPQNSGLFHAAISQSGTSLCTWALSTKPKYMAKKFGEGLNCSVQNSQVLSDCLLSKSTSEILGGLGHLIEWSYDPFTPFGPTVEAENPASFLTEHPQVLLESGKFNQVPWMTMLTKDEGILMHSAFILANPKLSQDLRDNWKSILPIPLHYNQAYTNWSDAEQLDVTEKVYKYYFGEKLIGEETREELTQLFSDRYFNYGIQKASRLAAKHVPVFPFIYAHRRPDWNILAFLGVKGDYGVSHADELSVLFNSIFDMNSDVLKGSETEHVSRNLIKLFTSFARDRNPSLHWTSKQTYTESRLPISLAEADGSKQLQYHYVDLETSVVQEPFTERLAFWSEILNEKDGVSASEERKERNEL